jgi:hypothetical protein
MTIEVLCPKGHRLACRDDRAGTWGKCPRCNSPVRIPSVNGQDAPSEIVFLCPNGHRLHGPAKLQGLPGKCPHCQSKFRIPVHGEDEPFEDVRPERIDDSIKGSHLGRIEPLEELSELKMPAVTASGASQEKDSDDEQPHPLAKHFALLWSHRGEGVQVEVHLAGGAVIVPTDWSESKSRGEYGVFAHQQKDGTHTVEVISWNSVERVRLSCVKDLPSELFPTRFPPGRSRESS